MVVYYFVQLMCHPKQIMVLAIIMVLKRKIIQLYLVNLAINSFIVDSDVIQTLKIVAFKNQYTFYINDTIVWSNVTLKDYTHGSIGLRTYRNRATYYYASLINDTIMDDILPDHDDSNKNEDTFHSGCKI